MLPKTLKTSLGLRGFGLDTGSCRTTEPSRRGRGNRGPGEGSGEGTGEGTEEVTGEGTGEGTSRVHACSGPGTL